MTALTRYLHGHCRCHCDFLHLHLRGSRSSTTRLLGYHPPRPRPRLHRRRVGGVGGASHGAASGARASVSAYEVHTPFVALLHTHTWGKNISGIVMTNMLHNTTVIKDDCVAE